MVTSGTSVEVFVTVDTIGGKPALYFSCTVKQTRIMIITYTLFFSISVSLRAARVVLRDVHRNHCDFDETCKF